MLAYSSNVDTVLTGSRCTRSALVHCWVFRAGHLKRDREFLFVGSWMELVPSNITAFWYFVYWSLLRVSTDHTVSLTDSSITVCKFRFNRSQEMFRAMDSPYHETLVQGREIAVWTIFEQKFSFMMIMLLSYVWVILSQNYFLVVPAQVQQSSTF